VTDRILWGYVVDFIILGKPTYWLSPAFNLADALQWVGYGLIVYAVIKEGEKIWPENNIRAQYWVNLKFQLKYCFILMGVGFGLTLICSIFSYTYLRVTILELTQQNPVLMKKFLSPFIFTFIIITIAFSAILFAIGKYISHRIAGPLYAFERFLTEALEGRAKPLKLRNGDEFRHLEELANQVRTQLDKMKSNQAQIHLENSTKSNTET
jgi:signal peptidase II